jgi:hypothetical protein
MASKRIKLPAYLIDRCIIFGQHIVDGYASGQWANSRAVSCFDAQSNAKLQAHSKMGECAATLLLGLDPESSLRWGEIPDPGYDLHIAGHLIDVKAVNLGRRFLLWSIKKNEFYQSKNFNVLLLVRGDAPEFEAVGWVTKEAFFKDHKVADENHPLFTGTWYMLDDELNPFEDLLQYEAA